MSKMVVLTGPQRNGTGSLGAALNELEAVSHVGELFRTNQGNIDSLKEMIGRWRTPILKELFHMNRFPFYVTPPVRGWDRMAGQNACNQLFEAVAKGKAQSEIYKTLNTDDTHIVCKVPFQQCPSYYNTWEVIARTKDVRIVYVRRPNLLDLLVSTQNALVQKQWHVWSGQEPKAEEVKLQPIYVLEVFCWLQSQIDYFDILFSKIYNDVALTIEFDDLMNNWDKTCEIIKDFLGISEGVGELKPITERQITVPALSLVKNRKQLQEYFAGTKWESYFEQPSANSRNA